MTDALHVKLRPLEREDLRFVHQLDNNASVMRYWFEEPYGPSLSSPICTTNIFTIKASAALSSNAMAIKPDWWSWLKSTMCTAGPSSRSSSPRLRGKGLATRAARLAMDYGFTVLNLYKLYLIVDKENEKAIHIYRKLGFMVEGELIHEFSLTASTATPSACACSSTSIWPSTKRPGRPC